MLLRRVLVCFGILGVVGCGSDPAHLTPSFVLGSCQGQDAPAGARCGRFVVPEDQTRDASRTLELAVVLVPALAGAPRDEPLVVFAGGPGQAATEVGPLLLPRLRGLHRTHDILLVDQRGTGSSSPLDCREDESESLTALFRVALETETIDRCLHEYTVDPALFTTTQAVEDLEDLREALGYAQLDLFGASYGTRVALEYMRRHPDRVRAAVLDGVAPPSMELPSHTGEDGRHALEGVFADCAESPRCAETFGELGPKWERVLAMLGSGHAVELAHPRTGRRETATISADAAAAIVRGALYTPEARSMVPLVIDRLDAGDFAPFAGLASTAEQQSDGMSFGMFLSVVCAEDMPQIDETEAARARSEPLSRLAFDVVADACAKWPVGEVPEDFHSPVTSLVPTLVLSGELNPVTPARWGNEVVETLERGRHVVVPGVGHGTWRHGCTPALIAEFLAADEPDADTLDTSCTAVLHRPEFFLGPAGTR